MTILDNIKPMETISNAQSRDTGNFGLKTQNKDKLENKIKAHKNHNAKDLKKLKKRDPTKTPLDTAIVFLL